MPPDLSRLRRPLVRLSCAVFYLLGALFLWATLDEAYRFAVDPAAFWSLGERAPVHLGGSPEAAVRELVAEAALMGVALLTFAARRVAWPLGICGGWLFFLALCIAGRAAHC